MRSFLTGLALLTLASNVFAEPESLSSARRSFCEKRLQSKHSIQLFLSYPENQLAFMNGDGFFDQGTCWWHSRFTRAAAYLAIFNPSAPKPTQEETEEIILRIRKRAGIVVIPGYRNLREFSLNRRNRDLIQRKLDDWQKSDTLTRFSWFNGMTKQKDLEPEKLEQKMDELYERVSRGEAVYQMLQMPGIMAHSWIVVGMERTWDGYNVHAIDSNAPGAVIPFPYVRGTSRMNYADTGLTFVPHTGHTKEERKLREKLNRECKQFLN